MKTPNAFPFSTGESHIERAHPHIVDRLRLLWGYPEGGRYLAKLIIDSRGGRTGFSHEVMSELMVLATIISNPGQADERNAPFGPAVRGAAGVLRRVSDATLSLRPIPFHSGQPG